MAQRLLDEFRPPPRSARGHWRGEVVPKVIHRNVHGPCGQWRCTAPVSRRPGFWQVKIKLAPSGAYAVDTGPRAHWSRNEQPRRSGRRRCSERLLKRLSTGLSTLYVGGSKAHSGHPRRLAPSAARPNDAGPRVGNEGMGFGGSCEGTCDTARWTDEAGSTLRSVQRGRRWCCVGWTSLFMSTSGVDPMQWSWWMP